MMRSICCASPGRRKVSRNMRSAVSSEMFWKSNVRTYANSVCLFSSAFFPRYSPICSLLSPGVNRRKRAMSAGAAGSGISRASCRYLMPSLADWLKTNAPFWSVRFFSFASQSICGEMW